MAMGLALIALDAFVGPGLLLDGDFHRGLKLKLYGLAQTRKPVR